VDAPLPEDLAYYDECVTTLMKALGDGLVSMRT
jgi:hypothetical protein